MTDRVIGDLRSERPGPAVLCVGGMHGSEPAGADAAECFLEKVRPYEGSFRGRFIAVRGNLRALGVRRRFVDKDLNRIWTDEAIAAVRGSGAPDAAVEYAEMRELLKIVDEVGAAGPMRFMDLHSTSSECQPFFWLVQSPGVQEVLPQYDLPIVFDPMDRVTGTLAQYVASRGHSVMIAEGGQHDSPLAVDHHEAILWITLVRVGCLALEEVRFEYDRSCQLLQQSRGGTPLLHDIVHHHRIAEGDGFRMKPGYESFQPVRRGEVLASDRTGDLTSPADGRILMPLYRPPCEDGFMIVQERHAWPEAAP